MQVSANVKEKISAATEDVSTIIYIVSLSVFYCCIFLINNSMVLILCWFYYLLRSKRLLGRGSKNFQNLLVLQLNLKLM